MESLREALEKAYDEVATSDDTESSSRGSVAPITNDSNNIEPYKPYADSTDADTGEEPVVKPIEDRKTPPTVKPGKVAGGKPAKTGVQQGTQAPVAGEPGDTTAAPAVKPPISWKPAIREEFSKLPPQVQAEITRREADIQKTMSESANSRKFHQDFAATVRPYEALIASSGVQPLQAVRNLMNTAATMQMGTQVQKATTLANIIKAYGVDIKVLDQVLSGQQPTQQPRQQEDVRAIIQREFQAREQAQNSQVQQRLSQEAGQTIEQFAADPKNEYYEDLREDMADLLDMAAQRGRVMTIQEAYDRATVAHPEISKLVEKKKAAEKLAEGSKNVQRSKRAAVSQGNGTPGNMNGSRAAPKGTRGAISQAWDDLSA